MMKLTKVEKVEIKKILEKAKVIIENEEISFICNILKGIENSDKALVYFKTEKPTREFNREFFKHINFVGDFAWWVYKTGKTEKVQNRIIRGQRSLFLKHLINKLVV